MSSIGRCRVAQRGSKSLYERRVCCCLRSRPAALWRAARLGSNPQARNLEGRRQCGRSWRVPDARGSDAARRRASDQHHARCARRLGHVSEAAQAMMIPALDPSLSDLKARRVIFVRCRCGHEGWLWPAALVGKHGIQWHTKVFGLERRLRCTGPIPALLLRKVSQRTGDPPSRLSGRNNHPARPSLQCSRPGRTLLLLAARFRKATKHSQ